MARESRPWFRFYTETLSDPKIRRLPVAQRWVWVAVLALARKSPVSGMLMISEYEPVRVADLADVANVPAKDVEAALLSFERLAMVHKDPHIGCLAVTNWDARQFESDSSSGRVAAHRERSKSVPCNGDGTLQKRSMERFTVTPETETETEKEKERRSDARHSPRKVPIPDDFALSEAMRDRAAKAGMDTRTIEREFEVFCDWHRAKDSRWVDWSRVWGTWVHRWAERHPKASNGLEGWMS